MFPFNCVRKILDFFSVRGKREERKILIVYSKKYLIKVSSWLFIHSQHKEWWKIDVKSSFAFAETSEFSPSFLFGYFFHRFNMNCSKVFPHSSTICSIASLLIFFHSLMVTLLNISLELHGNICEWPSEKNHSVGRYVS